MLDLAAENRTKSDQYQGQIGNGQLTRNTRTNRQTLFFKWQEHIVVPLELRRTTDGSEKLTVAIGNFSYLATIGDFIKQRASQAGLTCQFIEKPAEDIQAFLDQAAQQRLISGEGLETFEFSDDAVLDALKEADGDNSGPLGFDFDYDDSDEQIIEEQALDLAIEMMGTKIQQAAAKILINSARTGVSDIH